MLKGCAGSGCEMGSVEWLWSVDGGGWDGEEAMAEVLHRAQRRGKGNRVCGKWLSVASVAAELS